MRIVTPARRIGPRELARLLGTWATPGQPAYAALATKVRLLVLDGRLPVGVRLPPERELAAALGRSRTTAASAYDLLRESGYAASRQGSGTWTTLPGDAGDVPAWAPEPAPAGVVDLATRRRAPRLSCMRRTPRRWTSCRATCRAPATTTAACPSLRERLADRFTARGLSTLPEQILITSGALQAVRLALSLYVGAGDRVLVEQPGYPGGLDIVADLGARGRAGAGARRLGRPGRGGAGGRGPADGSARGVPDPGLPEPDRRADGRGAAGRGRERLLDGRTAAVIDESLVELSLEPGVMPTPFAAVTGLADSQPTVTVGSASKIFWGGLRVGWLRSDSVTIRRLAALRARQDLSSPILEQLACANLMDQLDDVRAYRVAELRERRDALVAGLGRDLPSWRFVVPGGGQVLWCELPTPSSGALAAAAADRGLRITPGSRFAADGTLESWVRLPYTRPVAELDDAVRELAAAWELVTSGGPAPVPVEPVEAYVV